MVDTGRMRWRVGEVRKRHVPEPERLRDQAANLKGKTDAPSTVPVRIALLYPVSQHSNPTMRAYYLACDLGAESGRLMLGSLENHTLTLEEVHRFPNTPLKVGDSLRWNIPQLFEELKAGLKKAASLKLPIASISR